MEAIIESYPNFENGTTGHDQCESYVAELHKYVFRDRDLLCSFTYYHNAGSWLKSLCECRSLLALVVSSDGSSARLAIARQSQAVVKP